MKRSNKVDFRCAWERERDHQQESQVEEVCSFKAQLLYFTQRKTERRQRKVQFWLKLLMQCIIQACSGALDSSTLACRFSPHGIPGIFLGLPTNYLVSWPLQGLCPSPFAFKRGGCHHPLKILLSVISLDTFTVYDVCWLCMLNHSWSPGWIWLVLGVWYFQWIVNSMC